MAGALSQSSEMSEPWLLTPVALTVPRHCFSYCPFLSAQILDTCSPVILIGSVSFKAQFKCHSQLDALSCNWILILLGFLVSSYFLYSNFRSAIVRYLEAHFSNTKHIFILIMSASLVAQLVKEFACNVGDLGSVPVVGRSCGEGKGYPLQDSGLDNSMDCIVHGVAKSWTQLSDSLSMFSLKMHPLKISEMVLLRIWTKNVKEMKRTKPKYFSDIFFLSFLCGEK